MSYADIGTAAVRQQCRDCAHNRPRLSDFLASGEAAITATLQTASDTAKSTTAADLKRFGLIVGGVILTGGVLSAIGTAVLPKSR